MTRRISLVAAVALVASTACGGGRRDAAPVSQTSTVPPAATTPVAQTPAAASSPVGDTPQYKHHSKLAGAAVGAAAGHMLGGHAVLGAAAGALIQHERNKHQAAHRP